MNFILKIFLGILSWVSLFVQLSRPLPNLFCCWVFQPVICLYDTNLRALPIGCSTIKRDMGYLLLCDGGSDGSNEKFIQ